MRDVLPDLDHVTPEWLTEVLQDQGHLQDGQQFPLMLRKSYMTMGANSALSVSTIQLCLLMCIS